MKIFIVDFLLSIFNTFIETFKHIIFKLSIFYKNQIKFYTIKYPYEKCIINNNGRYNININMNDCIVCKLCLKICPTNCINIDTVKSKNNSLYTSNGLKKNLLAKNFIIDMNKCMYCGMCLDICPTSCITMDNSYDKNIFDINEMKYQFKNIDL